MRRAALLAFLLVASAPAILAQGLTIDVPVRTMGDAWQWVGNASAGNATATATRYAEVVGVGNEVAIRQVTISNTSTFTNSSVDLTSWYRASDGALLRTYQYSVTSAAGRSTQTRSLTVYEAPCVDRAYPLQLNKTWEIACHVNITGNTNGLEQDTNDSRNETFRVVNDSRVDLASGSFPAVAVSVQDATHRGDRAVFAISPAACTDIAIDSIHRGVFTHFELVGWRCAATKSTGGTLDMTLPPLPPDEPPIALPTPNPGIPFLSPLAVATALVAAVVLAGKRQ